MLAMVGIKDVLKTATDLGITTLPRRRKHSISGLVTYSWRRVRLIDMTDAFSVFANKGYKVDPIAILKVTDINGKSA